jgi:signal peptidase I
VGVVFGPGAGHFLAGLPRRGVAFALTSMALAIAASVAVASAPSPLTVALYALPVLLHLGSLADLAMVPRERMRRRTLASVGQVAALLVAGVFLRNALRNHVVELYQEPSGSMVPTLRVGDHFFASKLGPPPGRGDVVTFPSPEAAAQTYVKRVVGLAGDRVEENGSVISINGEAIPRCELGTARIGGKDQTFVLEKLGGRAYLVVLDAHAKGRSNAWTVEPGELFVVGDNRDDSHDSRTWREGSGGGTPAATVIGRVTYRVFREGTLSFGPVDDLSLPRGAESLQDRIGPCRAELGGG